MKTRRIVGLRYANPTYVRTACSRAIPVRRQGHTSWCLLPNITAAARVVTRTAALSLLVPKTAHRRGRELRSLVGQVSEA